MPTVRSAKGTSLKPYTLSKSETLAVGRLVRACAEIEDIITLYLCRVAEVAEWKAILLLGRIPTSSRVQLARSFASARGPEWVAEHDAVFTSDPYIDVVKCRNTVAHGYLLGLTESGEIAFQVQETMGVNENRVHATVNAYKRRHLRILADEAERIIPQMEERFGLRALREKRRTLTLDPHLKAPPPRRPKAKREHQHRS